MNKEKIMKSENPCPSVKLYNADCMEVMAQYEDNHFDLAIVDPPYGIGDAKTDILNFRQKEQHREWNVAPKQEYFDELFRISKNQIVWGGNYFSYLWNFGGRCFIYWHKGNPVPNFADGELAWTSFDRNAKQLDYRYYGNLEGKSSTSQKFHPTQKPVALYEWLFKNYAKEGDKILDTHLGSGSIVIALDKMNKIEKMNLTLVGSELDEDYFKSACERIKEQTSQMTIFE